MRTGSEQVDYTVNLVGVAHEMTNRWGERFVPDKLEAYWIKGEDDRWAIEVINVSGVVILQRTGELGKRRRSEWFDLDTCGKLPDPMFDLVIKNRPNGASKA